MEGGGMVELDKLGYTVDWLIHDRQMSSGDKFSLKERSRLKARSWVSVSLISGPGEFPRHHIHATSFSKVQPIDRGVYSIRSVFTHKARCHCHCQKMAAWKKGGSVDHDSWSPANATVGNPTGSILATSTHGTVSGTWAGRERVNCKAQGSVRTPWVLLWFGLVPSIS